MNSNKTPLLILGLSVAAFISALVLTFHRLPERTASHFNAAGLPDGWMTRSGTLWAMGGVTLGLTVLLLGAFYGIRYLPASVINLPKREYWLGGERRADTVEFLFRAGVWLACIEVLLMLGVHGLLVAANLQATPRLSAGIYALGGGSLAAVIIWSVVVIGRFYRTPSDLADGMPSRQ
jgi:hypothetical protein